MFKVFKKVLVLWMLFVMVAVVGGGGDQLRSLQGDADWLTGKLLDVLAAKADSLKYEMDSLKERFEKWSGEDKELSRHSL